MKQITDDTATFENFRKPNVVYVDKTAYFHRLVAHPTRRFYFIARPRRFGKSLMLSTLRAIFEGRRELFEGLAISKTDYDWQAYPVIHLSFANRNVSTAEMAKKSLCDYLEAALREIGYDYNPGIVPEQNFANAIQLLYKKTGKQVVLLIDEYDAPVGEAFDDLEKAEAIRSFLADIYGQIKENEALVRFAMLTGVTRFTNLSVFSKLNTLVDLTLSRDFATMLGCTEEELLANFSEHLHVHAQVMGLSDEDYLEKLRFWYDGYRFSPNCEMRVYNPIAIAKTLLEQLPYFTATWSTTGRTTIVEKFARRNGLSFVDFQEADPVSLSLMLSSSMATLETNALLYQTGYLTIDQVRQEDKVTLRVPNEEVRRDYSGFLMRLTCGEKETIKISSAISGALYRHNFDELFTQLKSLYAAVLLGATKAVIHESFYQAVLQTCFLSLNEQVAVNVPAAEGFIDLVLENADGIFIFELKRSYNGTAQDAIAQIREKHYAEPYVAKSALPLGPCEAEKTRAERRSCQQGRPIFLIGLVFDDRDHRLIDTAVEPF